MDDDQLINELAPNSVENPGIYVPEENPEVREEAVEEETIMASALPIIQELIEWFDKQIDACNSVAQVMQLAKDEKVEIEGAMIASNIVRQILQSKRHDLSESYERFMSGGEE